jgi:mannan endo-1,4-beta-mannosidase
MRAFLSGANIPYINTLDFGSTQYDNQILLKGIAENKGNSIRIFLKHDRTLLKVDKPQSIINNLIQFLKAAQKSNIIVIICLWSVDINNQELNELIKNHDHDSLSKYSDNYLTPLVEAISRYNALGAWDIIDEPEKLVAITRGDLSPCDHFSNDGVLSPIDDKLTLESVLNFIGLHLSVINSVLPRKLTTVTISDDFANLGSCPKCFNYIQDECLRKASGNNKIGLDFYSINWKTDVLINNEISIIDKPVLISRYVVKSGQKFYTKAYENNYAGVLSWDYSSKKADIDNEMQQSFNKYMSIKISPDVQ